MIWSDVTIAGQTDKRTNEQIRKDIASHYSGWVTQPMDHGWLRWAINWLSMVCFKITWYKIFQNTIRQFSLSRESRESRILGILATSKRKLLIISCTKKTVKKRFWGRFLTFLRLFWSLSHLHWPDNDILQKDCFTTSIPSCRNGPNILDGHIGGSHIDSQLPSLISLFIFVWSISEENPKNNLITGEQACLFPPPAVFHNKCQSDK